MRAQLSDAASELESAVARESAARAAASHAREDHARRLREAELREAEARREAAEARREAAEARALVAHTGGVSEAAGRAQGVLPGAPPPAAPSKERPTSPGVPAAYSLASFIISPDGSRVGTGVPAGSASPARCFGRFTSWWHAAGSATRHADCRSTSSRHLVKKKEKEKEAHLYFTRF